MSEEKTDPRNGENPIDAPGYIYIDCPWVSGSLKGHGYSSDLLSECIKDSQEKEKKGLCILVAAKKKPFLADPQFLKYKGFKVCDGKYVTNEQMNDKKFLKLVGKIDGGRM